MNTTTLAWPQKIKPVFEQNTEIVEDCKAKFEESLQEKSENITKELEKLNLRVKELEDLGEMKNIQQYTYEVRQSIHSSDKKNESPSAVARCTTASSITERKFLLVELVFKGSSNSGAASTEQVEAVGEHNLLGE